MSVLGRPLSDGQQSQHPRSSGDCESYRYAHCSINDYCPPRVCIGEHIPSQRQAILADVSMLPFSDKQELTDMPIMAPTCVILTMHGGTTDSGVFSIEIGHGLRSQYRRDSQTWKGPEQTFSHASIREAHLALQQPGSFS